MSPPRKKPRPPGGGTRHRRGISQADGAAARSSHAARPGGGAGISFARHFQACLPGCRYVAAGSATAWPLTSCDIGADSLALSIPPRLNFAALQTEVGDRLRPGRPERFRPPSPPWFWLLGAVGRWMDPFLLFLSPSGPLWSVAVPVTWQSPKCLSRKPNRRFLSARPRRPRAFMRRKPFRLWRTADFGRVSTSAMPSSRPRQTRSHYRLFSRACRAAARHPLPCAADPGSRPTTASWCAAAP